VWDPLSRQKKVAPSKRLPGGDLCMGPLRCLLLLFAVAADDLEKPSGEPQQVELATTPAPTPVPLCKGGCPPNCNYPRLCQIHQKTYKCRCDSCAKCEGVKPAENKPSGKEFFTRRVVGPPK